MTERTPAQIATQIANGAFYPDGPSLKERVAAARHWLGMAEMAEKPLLVAGYLHNARQQVESAIESML